MVVSIIFLVIQFLMMLIAFFAGGAGATPAFVIPMFFIIIAFIFANGVSWFYNLTNRDRDGATPRLVIYTISIVIGIIAIINLFAA